jgi:hypothetical protein
VGPSSEKYGHNKCVRRRQTKPRAQGECGGRPRVGNRPPSRRARHDQGWDIVPLDSGPAQPPRVWVIRGWDPRMPEPRARAWNEEPPPPTHLQGWTKHLRVPKGVGLGSPPASSNERSRGHEQDFKPLPLQRSGPIATTTRWVASPITHGRRRNLPRARLFAWSAAQRIQVCLP